MDNVTADSAYHDNIISVLDKLINQSSISRFFNTSSGDGLDRVNGQYFCRPDLDLETCNSCVTTAVPFFSQMCSNKKQAVVWYNQCMVQYTNRTVSATLQTEPSNEWASSFIVSEPDIFPDIRNKTLDDVIARALMPENKDRFATGNDTFTIWEGFYAMVWCTPDITLAECETCLNTAVDRIPEDGLAQHIVVLMPSCLLKYETVQFIFPETSTPLTPSDP
ncbi:cysteine-rich repeat secretory protein 9-like [Silene latifolia]|uniref:cysteine-rich repeat secretory protein 9-like n=1 Tax=Silene latifolia TaxID=37657 RepID=UPI003D780C6B